MPSSTTITLVEKVTEVLEKRTSGRVNALVKEGKLYVERRLGNNYPSRSWGCFIRTWQQYINQPLELESTVGKPVESLRPVQFIEDIPPVSVDFITPDSVGTRPTSIYKGDQDDIPDQVAGSDDPVTCEEVGVIVRPVSVSPSPLFGSSTTVDPDSGLVRAGLPAPVEKPTEFKSEERYPFSLVNGLPVPNETIPESSHSSFQISIKKIQECYQVVWDHFQMKKQKLLQVFPDIYTPKLAPLKPLFAKGMPQRVRVE